MRVLLLFGLALFVMVIFIFSAFSIFDFQKTEVVIEWHTASELNTVGFNLYRSDSQDGDFVKVNDHLIPVANDVLGGGEYRFVDLSASAAKNYYYLLEDVDSFGFSEKHGPIEVKTHRNMVIEVLAVGFLLIIGGVGIAQLILKKSVKSLDREVK
jgi:hypothetical protein